jgi:hypothetical protein
MAGDRPRPESGEVERTARIFQAGSYPERGLEIGPGDLDAIAGAFSSPAPVLVEHLEGPLRLGWLTRVWREGASLFGRLVSRPRVAGAQVFSQRAVRAAVFHVDDEEESAALTEAAKDDIRPVETGEEGRDVAEIRERLRISEAEKTLKQFIEEGKIAPAAAGAALAILSADDPAAVCFADGSRSSAAQAFRQFLEAQPPVVLFGETAPAGSPGRRHGVSRDLLEAFGLSDDDIARYARMSEEEWNGRIAG